MAQPSRKRGHHNRTCFITYAGGLHGIKLLQAIARSRKIRIQSAPSDKLIARKFHEAEVIALFDLREGS